ncbi:MAG TPA: cell division protein SepF [Armatimonadota bacterium]|nr:cell division protein SepF [Armatimonadota bacterium]
MPSAGPLKKFMSWLNAEDEEEEFDAMESSPVTPAPIAAPTQQQKRQRGPLTLHGNSDGGMEIRHPRSLEDRMAIGMDLKQRRMVTLDLTKLPDSDARYFLEFVYGVVFALDATAEKVTEGIYLLAPRGISVRNDTESTSTVSTSFSSSHSTDAHGEQEELFWQGR